MPTPLLATWLAFGSIQLVMSCEARWFQLPPPSTQVVITLGVSDVGTRTRIPLERVAAACPVMATLFVGFGCWSPGTQHGSELLVVLGSQALQKPERHSVRRAFHPPPA